MPGDRQWKRCSMYYLYSSEKKCEAVYVCDEGKYIDSATLQTGVYPFGAILSKAIKLLFPCLTNRYSPFVGKGEYELSAQFNDFSHVDSSFSNAVCNDTAVLTVLKLLLIERQHLKIDEEKYDRLFELLLSYAEYIDLCQENKEFCKSENLRLLSEQNHHSLPVRSLYTAHKIKNADVADKDAMVELFTKCDLPEQFAPKLKEQRNTLWKLPSPVAEAKTTEWAPLIPPLHVFDIHDIVDLVLASLQCIFEEGHIIRKCFHCGSLFVTHRGNQKYCPAFGNAKNCYQSAKLQRQLEREKSGSAKMDKSIRTMYILRYGGDSKEYRDYADKSRDWRRRIRAKEAIEEEYIAWLKTHYKRKYREEKTAAET